MTSDPLSIALSAALGALGSRPDPDALAGYLADAVSGRRLEERSALVAAFRSGLADEITAGRIDVDEVAARLVLDGRGAVARSMAELLVATLGRSEHVTAWRDAAARAARLPRIGVLAAERSSDGRIRRIGVLVPDRSGGMRYAEIGRSGAAALLGVVGDLPLVGPDLPAVAQDLRTLGLTAAILVDLHETADWLVVEGKMVQPPAGLGLDSLAGMAGLPAPHDLRSRVAAASVIWLTLLRPALATLTLRPRSAVPPPPARRPRTDDICPSRDDAQPHIFEGGRCALCGTPTRAFGLGADWR